MAQGIIRSLIAAIALGALASAPSASADGLPVPGIVTPSGGLPGPDGQRYVTKPSDETTTVREIGPGNRVRATQVPGRFTIPAVALDGSPAGVSADGSTLVLIKPRRSFPQARTQVVLLDARNLTSLERVTFKGDFSFDAISPDGSTIYLIQYLAKHDPTRYAVRAYDVAADRLLPDPIVDPDEPAGEMRGYPMTRITSADGRWAYTLYDGGGDEPFVHALDTAQGRAVCVDLDGLVTPREVNGVHMAIDPTGGQLTLTTKKASLAVIDTESLEASAPPATAPEPADGAGGGMPWVLVAIAAALGLGAGGAILVTRHRRRPGLAARDA